MTDFDELPRWSSFAAQDAYRLWYQFPSIEKELGSIKGKRVLDVGCGTGLFPTRIVERGALAVGFDPSARNIEVAIAEAKSHGVDIQYFHKTQVEFLQLFSSVGTFDAATSNMVLPHARSPDDLRDFFHCASRYLPPSGRFISVVFSPFFSAFGVDVGPRRFNKLEENLVEAVFLDEPTGQTRSKIHQYTNNEYERAAVQGGMIVEAWKTLSVDKEAPKTLGDDFWEPVEKLQPFKLFITRNA